MVFPKAAVLNRDSADAVRDNVKRQSSPCSFFWSQGRSLCLAAEYFSDERLVQAARGGVAIKHRHRNQLAIFGQLMAAFEYMLKDYVAKAIDASDVFDEKLRALSWIDVTADKVLSQRVYQSSIGALLIHSTLGWHSPETVNERFKALFNITPILGTELKTLTTLWVLRHSVAHNAGFVTAHDASRIGQPELAEKVVQIDADFMTNAFNFLAVIAGRVASDCGKSNTGRWFKSVKQYGANFQRDQIPYSRVKHLGTCITSRTQDLPVLIEADYLADWAVFAR